MRKSKEKKIRLFLVKKNYRGGQRLSSFFLSGRDSGSGSPEMGFFHVGLHKVHLGSPYGPPWVFPRSALGLPKVLGLPMVYLRSPQGPPWVSPRSTLGLPTVRLVSPYGPPWVSSWSTLGLPTAHLRSPHGQL